MKKVVLCFVFLFLSTLSLNVISESAYATNFMTLHSFAGGAGDGEAPYGSLVLSRDGTTLYGMTDFGGSSSKGTIFCIPTIGGTLTVLHSFTGGASDGQWPGGNLTFSEDGTTLYGMTIAGGSVSSGTIFKIRTDGTGFELLHTFTDSEYPEGSLILCNSVLYGMASGGGDHDLGVIFKINTDGTGFTTLHSFSGDTSDGSSPHGSLTISGTTLYGMTYRGGELNMGVVFKIETDGTGCEVLHSFGGPAEGDGAYPQGSLFLSDDGSILYGMTTLGGANNKGTLFSIPITGGSNTILHSFAGEPSDGRYPYYTRIILSGSMLYGMTEFGGANNKGVICKIKTDGTEYSAVYSFGSIDNDGSKPCGDLIQYKNLLYGMALEGGEYNKGTIFYYVSGMAEVETGAVTNVETTTATGNGNITSLGSSNPTQHGVCWGTSHNPTIDDDHTEDGTVSETGAFTSSITGLTEGTTYYVRAYATNTEGISYGDEVSFTTSTSTSTALYLAEGCTNGFTEYILIQNPSDTTATITVTFMDDSGTKTPTTFSVNPYSRYTLNANNIVSNKSVGAKIESTVNTVSVERAMYWPVADRNGTGGHCSKAISAAATTWYFAEGCTQGFDEWMLILNPSETETAQVTVNFYDNAGNTTPASFTVSPHSRYTLHANDVISGTSTSAVIESTNSVSIVAERSMYWNSDNSIWTDGTCSFGSSSLATDWYFSEGCTDGFTEWILIYNPNGSSIDIAVTFYDESGNQATVPITVGANARYTLNVNNAINANKSISAKLHSTSQFTAERAMYWDSNSIASIGGHCSGGTATPSTNWYFAEGCTKGFDEYLVLFNPNTAAATVTITTMDSDGNTESFNYTVAGNSRKTIVVNSFYHGNKDVSLYITSTQTIVAERSMYWEDGSSSWTGGTCDLGKEVVIS